jgi:putative glutamine amidotransferase
MTGRPLIGISTYLESGVRWSAWAMEAALLPAGYPRLVQRAGGLAAMLPPDGPEHAAAAVARLDGLVIAGGPDVEPVRYGAERDPRTGPPARERDAWELALIDAALDAGVPLLGICRGMQLLNVALGGTLTQHIDGHAEAPGVFSSHPVKPVPGTRYAQAVPEETSVPTFHHQAVDRLGVRGRRHGGGDRTGTGRPVAAGRAVASGDGRGPTGDAGAGTGRFVSGSHARAARRPRRSVRPRVSDNSARA